MFHVDYADAFHVRLIHGPCGMPLVVSWLAVRVCIAKEQCRSRSCLLLIKREKIDMKEDNCVGLAILPYAKTLKLYVTRFLYDFSILFGRSSCALLCRTESALLKMLSLRKNNRKPQTLCFTLCFRIRKLPYWQKFKLRFLAPISWSRRCSK